MAADATGLKEVSEWMEMMRNGPAAQSTAQSKKTNDFLRGPEARVAPEEGEHGRISHAAAGRLYRGNQTLRGGNTENERQPERKGRRGSF